ncbi:probable ATP-dependent RNA helicase DDX20 [Palaemon carinicauda]|uniref:probable ATP-dependent RNA helicase DDX20 n=1 Tax=Palaemon carinicauda TaxID=392227 RepID=UPI0035B5A875
MALRKAHVIDDRERTVDIQIEENVDFRSMYLSEPVLLGLKASGFERPSPIQLAAIPLGRCGLDMVVQAKSGTGKTCVFAVVALEMVSVAASTTQVLVLTPTREIAVQVTQVISSIGSNIQGLRISTFIGGLHLSLDKVKLKCCHIAVGTPGRITQLIEMGLLRLDNVRLFVLDEADQLLTGQFADGIAQIASGLPLNKQVLALSATYTEDIAKVAEGLMRSPNHVRLGKDSPALIGIGQFVKILPYHHQPHRRQKTKFEELMNILCTVTFNQCLVFSNSQLRAESVCNKLRAAGWPVTFLTGGQAQQDRLVALDALCSYKCRVLVSTDLSARGLDSEHVNLVVNLDLPRDHSTYLHRIGRAGRFGSRGSAITLVTEGEEWQVIRAIASLANVRIVVLQGDLTSDLTSREEENQEFVEFLTDDDFSEYLNVANTYENNLSKKRNSKRVKTNGRNGNKMVADSCSSEDYVDCSSPLKARQGKNNTKKGKNSKKSSRKKLESERVADENEKAQLKALDNVISLVSKLNLEHSCSSVSFNEIMADVSDRYDSISADDNPSVTIPTLPDVAISVSEANNLRSHWNYLEENLQQVIFKANDSWKDCMFTIENALHSRIEGEKNLLEKMDVNLDEQILGSQHSLTNKKDDSSINKMESSSLKKGALKENIKASRVDKKKCVNKSYTYEYDPQSYNGPCTSKARVSSYSSDDITEFSDNEDDSDRYTDSSSTNVTDGNYMMHNFGIYQKYLDDAEKFIAMMDYVQTMGRTSYEIARHYHYGS